MYPNISFYCIEKYRNCHRRNILFRDIIESFCCTFVFIYAKEYLQMYRPNIGHRNTFFLFSLFFKRTQQAHLVDITLIQRLPKVDLTLFSCSECKFRTTSYINVIYSTYIQPKCNVVIYFF